MIDFGQDRYIVTSKDKEKILSYMGFKNTKDYKHNDANPILFKDKGRAKNYIIQNYNLFVDEVIYVKVKVAYVEYE